MLTGDDSAERTAEDLSQPAPERPAEALSELRELLVAYIRQEAFDPLKRIAAWLGFGLAGGVFVCTGLVLLSLGALRALQTTTGDHLAGNWSWAPYIIVLAGLGALFSFTRAAARARRRDTEEAS